MFWKHNNAKHNNAKHIFNNCQSALWCKHVQLGDKQKCTMHHSTKSDICFRTHVGKGGPTLYLYTATCHPCLVLLYSLHAIDLATACQWPHLPLLQPFNVQKSRLSCRRRARISQITFGPTYSSLFGVSGSMPSVSNKPGVLAAMMAWLTCAGVALGFWAR